MYKNFYEAVVCVVQYLNPVKQGSGLWHRAICVHQFAILSWLFAILLFFPLKSAFSTEPLTPCSTEPTDMTITFGNVIDCKIDIIADTDTFRFNGTANTVVVFTLIDPQQIANTSPVGGHPIADLYAPAGTKPIATINSWFSGMRSKEIRLPVTGNYTIKVGVEGNSATRLYRLGLDRVLPPSASKALCFECSIDNQTIDPKVDQDFYQFDAYKDATITLTLADRTGGYCSSLDDTCPELRLFGPDQKLVDTLKGTANKNLVLPLAGTYTIRVAEYAHNGIETYGLTLQCLFPPAAQAFCGPPIPPSTCNGLTPTKVGTDAAEVITGTAGKDVIAGLNGSDIIHGLGGDDVICGDSDQGGSGNDIIFGGDGNDRLIGNAGVNTLFGEAGNDILLGGSSLDSLYGGLGDDSLDGQGSNDVLFGGVGKDILKGGTGYDVCDNAGDVTAATACEVFKSP